MDLIFSSFLFHRGPTHSIVAITVLMIPFFIIYRKKSIPYFAALLSHILIGDLFTGGIELFWPLSQGWFGVFNYESNGLPIALTELLLFIVSLPLMYKMGDLQTLLKPNKKNWALIIPFLAVLGPLLWLLRGWQDSPISIVLVAPSLFWLALFTYSILIWLRALIAKKS